MVQIRVGDRVTVRPRNYWRIGNASHRQIAVLERHNDTQLLVTRVYEATVYVRGPIHPNGGDASIDVPRAEIISVNGINPQTGQPPVIPRKLGVKPEDTEELTHISVDDPRIQWLFQDMANFAEGKNWCSLYDELAEELGIPGREREWEVDVHRNGITMYATISARSETDARAKLEALLVDAE